MSMMTVCLQADYLLTADSASSMQDMRDALTQLEDKEKLQSRMSSKVEA